MMGAFFQESHQMLRLQQTAGSLLFDATFQKFRNLEKNLEKVRHCVSFQFDKGPKLEPVGKNESGEHKADQG